MKVKILKDSLAPTGKRMTTFELTYQRFFHQEFLTHRLLSRNAASSRAIPAKTIAMNIRNDPAMPTFWGANKAGMQAAEEIDNIDEAKLWWIESMEMMLEQHKKGQDLGLHKQILNRILEPWMNITVIVSATEWDNFFHLRTKEDAQPEFQDLAKTMEESLNQSQPSLLKHGEWHLPLLFDDDWEEIKRIAKELNYDPSVIARMVATGRCARVSYLTHDGKRDLMEDIKLHDRLKQSGHWSPFEHCAMALDLKQQFGNIVGFLQYRKFFINEHFIKKDS